ncbi:MAG: CRTAC1 family protein [Acidobacteriia bacterium]|nr:CRTAC1 family protein [Terriglobia bacterium]
MRIRLHRLAALIASPTCLLFSAYCQQKAVPADKSEHSGIVFQEVSPKTSSITWIHDNAQSDQRYYPESIGPGCAFLDYDNDGWMDIFIVNSGPSDFFTPQKPLRNALYHNNHDGTFTDVAEQAGIGDTKSFGMGVAVGDYDGDGWPDIYITAYGRNTLYHNNGNGTFTDVTEKSGTGLSGWFMSAVWFDYDNDGKLDLFAVNHVTYDKSIGCGSSQTGRRYYCMPRVYKPAQSHLLHNNGDGTFTDVSRESGIASVLGKSFGVVATDIDNDGRMDLFVSNDTVPDFLFHNLGNGKFKEIGLEAGVAYSDTGKARSGMGVDSADFDGDGWQDLFVANIDVELFSLYHNEHNLTFIDTPGEIAKDTRNLSGWGLKFFDYDDDGDPDLILSNGYPDDMTGLVSPLTTYREPLLMYENRGGVLHNVSRESGPVFEKKFLARGLAVGDFDNDGYLDVLVCSNGEAPVLLHNEGVHKNHWVGVQLVATASNPDSIGAILTWSAGGAKKRRLKTGGGSFLSAHDPREILGMGNATRMDSIEVRWPSGKIDRVENPPVDTYIRIVEGKGMAPPAGHP